MNGQWAVFAFLAAPGLQLLYMSLEHPFWYLPCDLQ